MLVMSFNVLCGGPGKKEITKRMPLVRDVIKKYLPDTFGLQEAHSQWMDYLCASLPEYNFVGVGREDGKNLGEYSPVFYKRDSFDKIGEGNFWLSETPEKPGRGWDAACVRICSYALLRDKKSDSEFLHFNTHLDHVGPVAQREGAKLIAERTAKYGDMPSIITGDFNVTPESEAYKTVISSGFSDARLVSENTDSTATFHDFGKCGGIIDFIFINKFIKAEKFTTVTDTFDGVYPSDHYPVISQIIF